MSTRRYIVEYDGAIWTFVAVNLDHLEARMLRAFGHLDGITLLAAEKLEVA